MKLLLYYTYVYQCYIDVQVCAHANSHGLSDLDNLGHKFYTESYYIGPRTTTTKSTQAPTTTIRRRRPRKTTTEMSQNTERTTSRYLTTPKSGKGRKWWWDIVG